MGLGTGGVLVLVRTVAQRQIVAACDRPAWRQGVRAGMTLAQARAMLPPGTNVMVQDHDPAGDAAALTKLARWALRWAPRAAIDPPDGLWLDITGCQRLYRSADADGEVNLQRRLAAALTKLGLTVRLAIAPSYAAAWALARFREAPDTIIADVRDLPAALGPLPIAALRIDQKIVSSLEQVGVEQIGQLLALPRRQLPSRYGGELVRRLEEALGQVLEAMTPVRAPEPVAERWAFAGLVKEMDSVTSAAQQLLDRLSGQLEKRSAGVRRLRLTLERYCEEPAEVTITLAQPTRDSRHLWRLLEPRLERLSLGEGVEAVAVRAVSWSRLKAGQRTTDWTDDAGESEHDAARGRLLDTLLHRWDRPWVWQWRATASYWPERVAARCPAGEEGGANPRDSPLGGTHPVASGRPTQLLESAEPVVVEMAGDEARKLRWRGRWQGVITCAGPERLAAEWWRGSSLPERDYFKVQTDDGRFWWLYRDNTSGQWWVHGWWG